MDKYKFCTSEDTAWCPGCGNFGIREALKDALNEMDISIDDLVISAGIGQAGKMPQYIDVNAFAGLHGRAIPVAIGIKMANHDLNVIAEGGDGDGYGEGGNHFLHAIRRNVNITQIVHDNQVYGLTKGQASPTTQQGVAQTYSESGHKSEKFKPLAVALAVGAGFVARGFSGDQEQLKEIFKAAIAYDGYALVDIMQPCVVWNKTNTFKWYKDRATPISEDHDVTNFDEAFKLANQWGDKIPTGILYNVESVSYTDKFSYLDGNQPLVKRQLDPMDAKVLMDKMR